MVIPTKITSGLSVSFSLFLPQYPASQWSGVITLVSDSQKITLNATPNGDNFAFSANAATTSTWGAGLYSVIFRVSSGDDVHQPINTRVTVLPNLAELDAFDARTDAEKALAAIRAVLANRATSDQAKLSFGGRSLEKTSIADLLKLESRFLRQVHAERRRKAGRSKFTINKVRMP